MKPGRRAFFLPRFAAATPWANFCQRLARAAQGRVDDETPAPGAPGRARLRVARDEDVFHARALCVELGVMLVLPGAEPALLPPDRHWLLLDIDGLDGIGPPDVAQGRIDVDVGCTFGALRQALAGTGWTWPHGDDAATVASWIAAPGPWRPGHCRDSGLRWADVMLAGGEFERLGPFGADATRPLRSAASSRLISSLFELSGAASMQTLLAQPTWLARYRLDALTPQGERGPGEGGQGDDGRGDTAHAGDALAPNPAHLLLGSRGTLAWTGRVQLQLLRDAPAAIDAMPSLSTQPAALPTPVPAPAAVPPVRRHVLDDMDDMVKGCFDPSGLFPSQVV
ncbi:hypothetical protein GCM10007242_39230 [Pigmentiphaga litoralis]|uniref:FAD-binding oxidoreductase n=1 Tax=Pigmentiphaga litoralis TaxID=516702 RepID=UPI001672AE96|nr:FAD-binding oxidoreductase [Pigmentiphaga litoralis]GGX28986.1 hypothetical protein GCM10007242_39230 [Pigmentiphaga litoralis]